jgi:hypothetical protein
MTEELDDPVRARREPPEPWTHDDLVARVIAAAPAARRCYDPVLELASSGPGLPRMPDRLRR